MKVRLRIAIIFTSLLCLSCATSEEVYEPLSQDEKYVYYDIDNRIEEDPEMSAFISPYVRHVSRSMSRGVTISEGVFTPDNPEGALGNLAADIIRYRATAEIRETVHAGVLDHSVLRMPLPEGLVTRGHIYELIPFEYRISVLRLSGEQLRQLADEIALVNGAPVSGMRFRISDGKARDVLVDLSNIDPNRRYWVATYDWLADGGGSFPSLWDPEDRHDLDVLVRDAVIDNLNGRERIEPYRDQRIRN